MRDVYVAGTGMTLFAKQPGRTLKDLAAEAVRGALEDAGVPVDAVQGCWFANAVAGSITGQEMVAAQVTLRPVGLGGIPMFNVENACASASSAFHLAWQAVAAGACDVALAVGAEKMTHPDRARSFAAIGGSVDMDTVPEAQPPDRSFLMDLYAGAAVEYMEATGATIRDFAEVVVKNQRHGMHNPLAQYGGELTADEVLASRPIVWRSCARRATRRRSPSRPRRRRTRWPAWARATWTASSCTRRRRRPSLCCTSSSG